MPADNRTRPGPAILASEPLTKFMPDTRPCQATRLRFTRWGENGSFSGPYYARRQPYYATPSRLDTVWMCLGEVLSVSFKLNGKPRLRESLGRRRIGT